MCINTTSSHCRKIKTSIVELVTSYISTSMPFVGKSKYVYYPTCMFFVVKLKYI